MLPVLWIEDEEQSLNNFAGIVLSIGNIALHVLYVGKKPLEGKTQLESEYPSMHIDEIPECRPDGVSLEYLGERVCKKYGSVQPWMVLMDLWLDSLTDEPSATLVGSFKAPGIALILRLYEECGAQNIVSLSMYGREICQPLCRSKIEKRYIAGVQVVGWPETYFLAKDALQLQEGTEILRQLTNGALDRLRRESAIDMIPASSIQELFWFVHRRSSLSHFVIDICKAGSRALWIDFLKYPLLPGHTPLLSIATWLLAWHNVSLPYDPQVLDTEQFTIDLETYLSKGMWGMDIPEFARHLCTEAQSYSDDGDKYDKDALSSKLLTLQQSDRVIGPMARGTFWQVVRDALENARTFRPVIEVAMDGNAIYLFICNPLSIPADEMANRLYQKANDGELHGIASMRAAVHRLNSLHGAQSETNDLFGRWGFGILIDGDLQRGTCIPVERRIPREDRYAFIAGGDMSRAEQICREMGWGTNAFIAAFRLPLVLPNELAQITGVAAQRGEEGVEAAE
jgi:hypothetical protein